METSFECLKKFIAGYSIDMEMVKEFLTNVIESLGQDTRQQLQDSRKVQRHVNVINRLYYMAQLFPTIFTDAISEKLLGLLKKWLEVSIFSFAQMRQGVQGYQTASQRSDSGHQALKVASSIVKLFENVPPSNAPQTIIEMLCKLVFKTEMALNVEPGSVLRQPLVKYLVRFPAATLDYFLLEATAKDAHFSRFLVNAVDDKDQGKPFRDTLSGKVDKLSTMAALGGNITPGTHSQLVQMGIQQPGPVMAAAVAATNSNLSESDRAEVQFVAIKLTHVLVKHDEDGEWVKGQGSLINTLKAIWNQESYHVKHKTGNSIDYSHWKETKIIVKILLAFFKQHQTTEILLLFQLLRALCGRYVADFQFLKDFLEKDVCEGYSVDWKRAAFFEFVRLWKAGDDTLNQDLKAKILQYIIIPSFSYSFEKGDGEKLIGSPPAPDQDVAENVVSTFILEIIDPDNPFKTSDTVRILLLQFSCLLVDEGAAHIHDAGNKRQGNKLRRLMTYAWPCLLSKNCVDPATRYHGHLLLSHIIAKFAIHKRIVLQVNLVRKITKTELLFLLAFSQMTKTT